MLTEVNLRTWKGPMPHIVFALLTAVALGFPLALLSAPSVAQAVSCATSDGHTADSAGKQRCQATATHNSSAASDSTGSGKASAKATNTSVTQAASFASGNASAKA